MSFDHDSESSAAERPGEAGPPAAGIVDRTMVLPRLYTGETMILPAERKFLRLRVTAGPDAGRTFSVGAGGGEIGRLAAAAVMLTDPAVSRRHARIEFSDGAFQLVDLGSANGTFVNGERLQAATLEHGDTLTLGHNSVLAEIATLE